MLVTRATIARTCCRRVPRSQPWSGEGQDLGPVVGDEQGVLELRAGLPVAGDDGPVVVPHVPLAGAEVQHRLDGERHAGLDGLVVVQVLEVGDDQPGVERGADAVPGELAYDAVPEPFRVALDDAADDVDLPPRLDRVDGPAQGLTGAVDQVTHLLRDTRR